MTKYHVVAQNFVEAESPEEAVQKFFRQENPSFTVTTEDGGEWEVGGNDA